MSMGWVYRLVSNKGKWWIACCADSGSMPSGADRETGLRSESGRATRVPVPYGAPRMTTPGHHASSVQQLFGGGACVLA